MLQADSYFEVLKESERPRHQLVHNFQSIWLLDRDERVEAKLN